MPIIDPFDKPEIIDPFDQPGDDQLMPAHRPELKAAHERVVPKQSGFSRVAKGTIRALEPLTRPALEGGGMIAGGAIGAAAGLPTGPGAAATGIAGGAGGYAIGKGIQDTLDIYAGTKKPYQGAEAFTQTAKDVGTGVLLEGGGRVATKTIIIPVFKGGKWIFKKVAGGVESLLSKKGVEKAAQEILQAHTSEGTIYAKNAEEAAKIEKEIPGLKFTLGQRTGDPSLLKLERTQLKAPGGAAAQNAEQIASNNEALRAYYEKSFSGKEGVDDLIGALRGKETALKTAAETAEQQVSATAAELPKAEPVETGQRMLETLQTGKESAKKTAGELYGQIPEAKIPVKDMLKEFDDIAKPMSKFEEPGNIPPILSRVNEIMGDGTDATLADLQGLRSELLAQARQVSRSQVPNERLASRLYKAADAVESAITSAETAPAVEPAALQASPTTAGAITPEAEKLKAANKFFRENYIEKFKQRTIGDILKKGARGETSRIPVSQIPNKIWNFRNTSAADDFIKAVGKGEATNIMRDHAAYDLMQNATDPTGKITTKQLNIWLKRNARLLDKFGIADDLKGLVNAQAASDAANQAAASFEKSAAARMLKADPEKAIGNAIKGANTGQAAQELMGMVRGNKAAENGLKKAFADHIMNSVQTTAKDVAGNPTISNAALSRTMKKYMPAMRFLYKSEPEKLKALMTIQKAFEVLIRNAKSPIGGGPETAETLLTQLGKLHHLSRSAAVVKGLVNALKKYGDKEVNDVVTRALFDPDYAVQLNNAFKKNISASEIQEIVNGKIISLEQYRNQRMGRAAAAIAAVGTSED